MYNLIPMIIYFIQGTRFVTIDLTVYNANVNLFCLAKSVSFSLVRTLGSILRWLEAKDLMSVM